MEHENTHMKNINTNGDVHQYQIYALGISMTLKQPAPCAAASTSKFIRRTEGGAAKDPGAPVATPPATAAKVDKARKAPAAT